MRRAAPALLPLLCAALLLPASAQAELPTSVSRGYSSNYYGDYEPRVVNRLNELPPQIATRVVRHLQQRLGDDRYKELKFESGEIVVRQQLLAREPAAADYQWEVPAYRLHFSIRRPEVGIDVFVATMELRVDGSILNDIELPCFKCHPEKAVLVGMAAAAETAAANGMSGAGMEVGIDYDRDSDSMVWVFSKRLSAHRGAATEDRLLVNAHTGAVVRREQRPLGGQ